MKLKIFSWLFFILSIGLTFVSLSTGFYLYNAMFTLSTAVLICVVFEILRLSSLYAISAFYGVSKFIVSFLYVIIAFICFFASVISLDTQIIQKNNIHTAQIEKQVEADLFKIRIAYSKKYDEELEKLIEKKDVFQRKIASNPKSKYYEIRIEQTNTEIENLSIERQNKLNELSFGNIKRNEIKTHLSILGISDGGTYDSKDISEFQEALNGIFSFDVIQLQKIIGYSLAFGIEAGILLLAVLGFYLNKQKIQIETSELTHKAKVKEDCDVVQENPEEKNENLEMLPKTKENVEVIIQDNKITNVEYIHNNKEEKEKPIDIKYIKNPVNKTENIEKNDKVAFYRQNEKAETLDFKKIKEDIK